MIVGLYQFAAILAALGTVAAIMVLFDRSASQVSGVQIQILIGLIVGGGITVLTLVAIAESIKVVVDRTPGSLLTVSTMPRHERASKEGRGGETVKSSSG